MPIIVYISKDMKKYQPYSHKINISHEIPIFIDVVVVCISNEINITLWNLNQ